MSALTASFARMASVTASTKRSAGILYGLERGYIEEIASLKCTPLDPVDPNVTLGIDGLGWHQVVTTAVAGALDIREGDILVVGEVEYPVRAVADWTWPPITEVFQMLLLEKPV